MAKERELSKKNPYHLSKERTKELEWFCRQYPMWVEELKDLGYVSSPRYSYYSSKSTDISDPTPELAMKIIKLKKYIHIVDQAAELVREGVKSNNPRLNPRVQRALQTNITYGVSYNGLNISNYISEDGFYKMRREFFYYLDKLRD